MVRTGPVTGLIAQVALLAVLTGTVGLSVTGWLVGLACGLITNATLERGLARSGAEALGPADRVTLTRATLAVGAAALVAESFVRPVPAAITATIVAIAVVALVLDAVDGWVARHTDTASPFGARVDMEVDAFLIFVLSVDVARSVGPWVLVIGAARYVFVVAGWLLLWLREPTPPRYWCKTVAAIQGVVLTIAVADVLPGTGIDAALGVALALLTESFGRDVWGLWHHHRIQTHQGAEPLAMARAESR
jgi:phosphatidylglycerophosphate synthase